MYICIYVYIHTIGWSVDGDAQGRGEEASGALRRVVSVRHVTGWEEPDDQDVSQAARDGLSAWGRDV